MRGRGIALLFAGLLLSAAGDPGAQVGAVLAKRLGLPQPPAGQIAWADLDGDGRDEALFLVSDRDFCGSGGCSFYVVARNGASWRVVSASTLTRAPVRVLETRTQGWRDLAVTVSGGGGPSGEVRLRFNGKRYPGNPSLAPKAGKAPGRTVIAE